jgi:hypothetical protein
MQSSGIDVAHAGSIDRFNAVGLGSVRLLTLPNRMEAVAQTLGVIDFLCIHDKATISEGAFSVAESPVRPPEALL